MKIPRLAVILAFAVALAVPSIVTSQAVTPGTYQSLPNVVFGCSPGGGYYCYDENIVYLDGDSTQPASNIWLDAATTATGNPPNYGFICFMPDEPYGVITPTPLSPMGCGPRISQFVTAPVQPFTSAGRTGKFPPFAVAFFTDETGYEWTYTINLNWFWAGGRYPHWQDQITKATLQPFLTGGYNSATTLAIPTRPIPEIGTEFVQVCGWNTVFPPYLPTGRVGIQGIEVSAQCSWYNTTTGTYSNWAWSSWWIPWSIWFNPFGQNSTCEVANYPSSCSAYVSSRAGASTPQYPSL